MAAGPLNGERKRTETRAGVALRSVTRGSKRERRRQRWLLTRQRRCVRPRRSGTRRSPAPPRRPPQARRPRTSCPPPRGSPRSQPPAKTDEDASCTSSARQPGIGARAGGALKNAARACLGDPVLADAVVFEAARVFAALASKHQLHRSRLGRAGRSGSNLRAHGARIRGVRADPGARSWGAERAMAFNSATVVSCSHCSSRMQRAPPASRGATCTMTATMAPQRSRKAGRYWAVRAGQATGCVGRYLYRTRVTAASPSSQRAARSSHAGARAARRRCSMPPQRLQRWRGVASCAATRARYAADAACGSCAARRAGRRGGRRRAAARAVGSGAAARLDEARAALLRACCAPR